MVIKNFKKYFRSPFVTIAVICFILSGIFFFFPQNKNPQKNLVNNQKISIVPSLTQVQISPTSSKTVMEKGKPLVIDSPTPTPTAIIQQETAIKPTSPQAPDNSFKINVDEPDGNLSFSIPFHDGTNPCSVLTDAKNSGNIKSVTVNHYGAPLNSDYVKEINGFSDNWNFSINGNSMPKGCSNYNLNSGDTVLWKYN